MRTADATGRYVRVQWAATSRSASAASCAAQRSGYCRGYGAAQRRGARARVVRAVGDGIGAAERTAGWRHLRMQPTHASAHQPARRCTRTACDAAMERHRAVAGTLPGAAQTARCSVTAGGATATTAQRIAGSKQWCDVGTPSTPWVPPSQYSECSTCVCLYSLCRAPPGRARRGCASRHGRLRRHRIPRRRARRGRHLQRTTAQDRPA